MKIWSNTNTNTAHQIQIQIPIQIHTEAETKLPPFYRWHIQIHCTVRRLFQISLKIVSKGPTYHKPPLAPIMAWRWVGNKPLLLGFVRTRVLISQSRLNIRATMEADILSITGSLTPEAASISPCCLTLVRLLSPWALGLLSLPKTLFVNWCSSTKIFRSPLKMCSNSKVSLSILTKSCVR